MPTFDVSENGSNNDSSAESGNSSTRARLRPLRFGDRLVVSSGSTVGRVGALAVALGIGAAVVALPVSAFADTAGSAGSAGSSDSSASGGASSGGSRGHAGPRSRSGAGARSDEGSSVESGAGSGSESTGGSAGVSGGLSRPAVRGGSDRSEGVEASSVGSGPASSVAVVRSREEFGQ